MSAVHIGEIMTMVAGVATIVGVMQHRFSRIEAKLGSLDTKVDSSIAGLRQEFNGHFVRIDNRLTNLEQRTFEISRQLGPAPTPPSRPPE